MGCARVLRRLVGAIVVGTVLAALPVGAVAAGAVATSAADSSDQVLVSSDGTNFAPALATGLFSDAGNVVPGDVVADTVWIRNPTGSPASLRVSARDVLAPTRAWADHVEVSVWNSGTRTTEQTTLDELRGCDVLVPTQTLAAGDTIELVLRLQIGDWTGTAGQDEAARFVLVAAMRDAGAPPFPASACEDDGVIIDTGGPPGPSEGGTRDASTGQDGALAWTGTRQVGLLAAAGGVLVGFGAVFLSLRRTRRET